VIHLLNGTLFLLGDVAQDVLTLLCHAPRNVRFWILFGHGSQLRGADMADESLLRRGLGC
jgi:hypothetical protein